MSPSNLEDWPATWARALDDGALAQASTVTLLQRGKAYAASGAVKVTAERSWPESALQARVAGTDLYTTEVGIEDGAVAGRCDCPHAEDGWFCKHQVAVALVWRQRLEGFALPAGGDTVSAHPPPRARTTRVPEDPRQALHDFLHGLDASTLAARLLDLADREHDIARELHQWRQLRNPSDRPEDLEALINDLLSPGRDFIAWNESHGFVHRAKAVLPLLRSTRERSPEQAAALGLHALRRAWRVIDQADDSDGEIGGLCEAIGTEWMQCLQAAGSQPAAFGETLLQVQLDDPLGSVDIAAARDVIGPAAMDRYQLTLARRWRQAKDAVLAAKAQPATKARGRKVLASTSDRSAEREAKLWTLEPLYLAQLEHAGQIDEALAVLREDLSDALAYSRVTEFLERHGRWREAFAQAERGLQAFPDNWRLQEDMLRNYERDGWTREALVLRRKQFERRPDVACYHRVLQAGQAEGEDVAALRQAMLEFLAARETASSERSLTKPLTLARTPATVCTRNVSLRAEILCSEKRWMEACKLVQPPAVCRDQVLVEIASHLPTDHDEQAVALLLRVFYSAMQHASSPYRSELALVGQITRRMAIAQRKAWLLQLQVDYKAKRNFVRDLPKLEG